jgi:thioredoxin 1
MWIAAAIFATQAVGCAQTPFAPFEAWKSAVANGDEPSVAKLYPAAGVNLRVGKDPIARNEEIAWWAGLKRQGMMQFTPRILETRTVNGNTLLLLRVSAQIDGTPVVVSGEQLWAHTADGWKIAASTRSKLYSEAGRRLPEPAIPNVNLYPDPREAEADLKAGLTQAAKEHKRVIVVLGGNWCYDCDVLDATFHSKAFAPLVDGNYVVVHINIGDEGKDNGPLGARLGVALDKGVPSLGVLDPDGKVVYAQKNGEFESTVKIGPDDVRAFLEKWKPVRA